MAHARQQWPDADIDVIVKVDPRLRLQACDDLAVELRGQQQIGRVHVAARCGSPKAWSVYLPAEIIVSSPVLVAARPLLRGERLTRDDVILKATRLSGRTGALVNPAGVTGLTPKRAIPAGTVLSLSLFSAVPTVTRQDIVRLVSGRGTVRIETKGRALANAQVGEQVMVENLTSGRRVVAWVVGPGTVSTQPGGAM